MPPSADPWKARKRRPVDLPIVTCGIAIDTSGSMGGSEDGLAASGWVLSNAIADNGGRTVGYAFGNGVERFLEPEAPPRFVTSFKTGGGTAGLPSVLDRMEDDLAWEKAYGPRLLVIVSDGAWGDVEKTAARLREARAKGVRILLVGIKSAPTDYGKPELFDEQLVVSEPMDLARFVGKAAVDALREF